MENAIAMTPLVYLQIIAPDEWYFKFQGTGSERVHTSRPQNRAGKTLHVGIIDITVYEEFLARLDKLLEEAMKRQEAKGSAAHKKTLV